MIARIPVTRSKTSTPLVLRPLDTTTIPDMATTAQEREENTRLE